MKTVNDFNFENKKALIRVDFNVPLDEALQVTDTTRIEAAKPTILKVLEDGGSAVLMSHLGRPKGVEQKFSLKNIVDKVSDIIGVQVKYVNDCIGPDVEAAVADLQNGEVLILENLRFYSEEKAGDKAFAEKLSKNGDIYINDAFGTAHRAHASTAIIAEFFPENKCFGLLLAKEIESLEKVLGSSERPVTAILGGSKVSSKITVIENILDKIANGKLNKFYQESVLAEQAYIKDNTKTVGDLIKDFNTKHNSEANISLFHRFHLGDEKK